MTATATARVRAAVRYHREQAGLTLTALGLVLAVPPADLLGGPPMLARFPAYRAADRRPARWSTVLDTLTTIAETPPRPGQGQASGLIRLARLTIGHPDGTR